MVNQIGKTIEILFPNVDTLFSILEYLIIKHRLFTCVNLNPDRNLNVSPMRKILFRNYNKVKYHLHLYLNYRNISATE